MTLQPARGYMFVEAVDEIIPSSKEVGFGSKTEKFKLEEPYKFRVIAVGRPRVGEGGVLMYSEVGVGELISSVTNNSTYRDKIETSGFLLDGKHILVMDFTDVIGVWRDKSENSVVTVPDSHSD